MAIGPEGFRLLCGGFFYPSWVFPPGKVLGQVPSFNGSYSSLYAGPSLYFVL